MELHHTGADRTGGTNRGGASMKQCINKNLRGGVQGSGKAAWEKSLINYVVGTKALSCGRYGIANKRCPMNAS